MNAPCVSTNNKTPFNGASRITLQQEEQENA